MTILYLLIVSNLCPADAFKKTIIETYETERCLSFQLYRLLCRLKETKLPAKEQFYSILNDEHITSHAYEHAQNVWNTFNIQSLGEYHDLYLKCDVLLFADVFENFRKTCLQYKLDPCHYFTSPGLAWDTMLKMTSVKLELMYDVDMYQFIEKGMRVGISYIANRYVADDNKNKLSKYVMYLDVNNLYRWAMSQSLPIDGFQWMEPSDVELNKYNKDSNKGFILEVDLDYLKELHNLDNDYPLAPEKTVKKKNCQNIVKVLKKCMAFLLAK